MTQTTEAPLVPVAPTAHNDTGGETQMNNIRELRQRHGISLNQMQRLTGIHKSNLSRLERGKIELFPGWKLKLEDVFGEPITTKE